ncbi:hypothetical protein POTOM_040342 [Populus tomentosa]|uniref:Cytochrome P450 n=1 Tax=Populus tomentosa TaxID=118781 RepID=A0A8X7YJU4_POPTO|nr:hypothetical protein POTOM_040342 [Populus tomentosa]
MDMSTSVRGALVSFLQPEVSKQYVGKIDEVWKHFEMHWHGKQKISAMLLMKTLTFNILSSLIIGIEQGEKRDILVELFQQLLKGVLSVPINLPFTCFNHSLRASEKIQAVTMDLIHEIRTALEHRANFDLITSLLSLRNKDNSASLSDQEIIDIVLVIMIAGYDTSSILLTFLIGLLANNPSVYASICQGENCQERVVKDFEHEGYLIPKGWQVAWSACMTHMNECIFPDPSKFEPRHSEKSASLPPYSFVALCGGQRICPGYEFARLETLITVHYLVNRFTWKLCCQNISFSRDPMPTFKDGLEIEIEPKIPD